MCNVSLVSPIFALITVFLKSLGSLHVLAILGSILSVVFRLGSTECRKGIYTRPTIQAEKHCQKI
jgi:hypothetical protein